MPGSDPAPPYLLIGALVAILVAWEALARRDFDKRDTDARGTGEQGASPAPASPSSLLSYLSAVGGVWLIPWAAALYAAAPVALLPGLLLVGVILICARYALQDAAPCDER
ncbi:MAG: hypothetical protein JXA09_17530 [Anaerolineae bacterium]|nr:hypothetical protein [Anaerolineae bacterium]